MLSIFPLMRPIVVVALLVFCRICGTAAEPAAHPPRQAPQTFVIVHGAWGGGWAFKDVERRLRANGHTVYRPTLTGQGEKVHLAHADIDLTTHVNDVTNVILWENLRDIVLVGHSYGGMVISGVLDRVADRVKHAIFLDALVPNDGESLTAAFGDDRLPGELKDGFIVPPWVRPNTPVPHDVPHPAKTLTEPVSFKNPAIKSVRTTYILTVDPGKAPREDRFFKFFERAKERGWSAKQMEADHNPQWSKPAELVEILESSTHAP